MTVREKASNGCSRTSKSRKVSYSVQVRRSPTVPIAIHQKRKQKQETDWTLNLKWYRKANSTPYNTRKKELKKSKKKGRIDRERREMMHVHWNVLWKCVGKYLSTVCCTTSGLRRKKIRDSFNGYLVLSCLRSCTSTGRLFQLFSPFFFFFKEWRNAFFSLLPLSPLSLPLIVISSRERPLRTGFLLIVF